MTNIYWSAVNGERSFYNGDGTRDAGAETARLSKKNLHEKAFEMESEATD